MLAQVAAAADIEPKSVGLMMDTLADIIRKAVLNGDKVAVPSFGTFAAVKRDETIAVDHASGKRMLLPPQIELEFTPAAMLRKKISHE